MRRALALAALLLLCLPAAAQARILYAGYTWNVFDGVGNLGQRWSASHVSVAGGVLREEVSGGVAGGVGMLHWQTFGSYSVRFRMSKGGGKYAILLFGKGPHEEVDFAEGRPYDSERRVMTGTLHYGAANEQVHVQVAGDFSQWHTAGLEWRPGVLLFLLDGRVWARIASPNVPSGPMHMTIQTSAHGGSPSALEVSHVALAP